MFGRAGPIGALVVKCQLDIFGLSAVDFIHMLIQISVVGEVCLLIMDLDRKVPQYDEYTVVRRLLLQFTHPRKFIVSSRSFKFCCKQSQVMLHSVHLYLGLELLPGRKHCINKENQKLRERFSSGRIIRPPRYRDFCESLKSGVSSSAS